jgi:hypothetical protein
VKKNYPGGGGFIRPPPIRKARSGGAIYEMGNQKRRTQENQTWLECGWKFLSHFEYVDISGVTPLGCHTIHTIHVRIM